MSRVLIVEDDQDLANVVCSLLELEEHIVDLCHTGEGGLISILTNPYDLVILDWQLPGVSGLEILSQFRQIGAKTPVIMLTGKNSIEDKESGLDGGADDYLTKPFNMKEFKARVRAQLRRSTLDPSHGIKLGGIELDCANRRASKSGRTYALPSEEYQLLEFAAKYPHIQPSLSDLLALAWPEGVDKNEDKVEQAIKQLRRKFDPSSSFLFAHLLPATEEAEVGPAPFSGAKKDSFQEDLYVGTIFDGKYEIIELIGDGASGLVFRSKHIDLGTDVALKILHFNTLSHPETIPRFTREARATAQLSHTNIVAVRDFGLGDQNQPYLVMELLEGASLTEVLYKNGPPPLVETLKIFCQVCAGLDHAHEKGLIHRDMKPSNLILTTDGYAGVLVKIIDFGLARSTIIEEGARQITETGIIVGSPPYMSPEQCRGLELDRRSDLYSVGCSLYETLQGRLPFFGKDSVSTLMKHLNEAPPEVELEATPPLVQVRLNKVVSKCLAKDAKKRYQTAFELMQALEEILSMQTAATPQLEITRRVHIEGPWSERKKSLLSWLGRRFSRDS